MLIECSFPSRMEKLASRSKHLTPSLLFNQLKTLKRSDIALYINHVKPLHLKEILKEIIELSINLQAKIVQDGEIIKF